MGSDPLAADLSDAQFQRISELVRRLCGINLQAGKEGLVKARLAKRLRALGLKSYDEYVEFIEGDRSAGELSTMVDALTTNKTGFFREPQHFDYLRDQVLPGIRTSDRSVRFWSAGCSSGEEPYTLAVVLREAIPDVGRRDVRILGTDISSEMVQTARKGVYREEAVRDVPADLLRRHFVCVRPTKPRMYKVNGDLKTMVWFARLNLMDPWPMKGPFDAVFCRNVMIYFDNLTREMLVQRFWELLRPGGHLYVGHSESLTTTRHRFAYVRPAVYVK